MSNRKIRTQFISAELRHEVRGMRARIPKPGSSTLRVHKLRHETVELVRAPQTGRERLALSPIRCARA